MAPSMRGQGSSGADGDLTRLQAEFCRGMAHPKRIQILRALETGEKSVSELSRATSIRQTNMSQHLSILRQFGLLDSRKEGTTVYYSISDRRIVEACDLVRSCIEDKVRMSQLVLTVSG